MAHKFRIKEPVRILAIALLLLTPAFAAQSKRPCPAPVTRLSMEKGDYSPMDGVTFDLAHFDADMVAKGKTSPLCYQRVTDIRHGDVAVSPQSLSHEFESKMQQSNSKVTDFKVETKDHTVAMSGKVKKVIDIPFTIEGPVSTDGQSLIFHADHIKAEGIPVKGLLGMLGDHLSNLLKSESVKGVMVKDNTIVFQTEQIANVKGHIASADVTPQGLLLKFTEAPVKQAKK